MYLCVLTSLLVLALTLLVYRLHEGQLALHAGFVYSRLHYIVTVCSICITQTIGLSSRNVYLLNIV